MATQNPSCRYRLEPRLPVGLVSVLIFAVCCGLLRVPMPSVLFVSDLSRLSLSSLAFYNSVVEVLILCTTRTLRNY